MKKLWIYLCYYARRANPRWQERRYSGALKIIEESGAALAKAVNERDSAQRQRDSLRQENAEIRKLLGELTDRFVDRKYRHDRDNGFYMLTLTIRPDMVGGISGYDGMRYIAQSVAMNVEAEIATSKFIRMARDEEYKRTWPGASYLNSGPQ